MSTYRVATINTSNGLVTRIATTDTTEVGAGIVPSSGSNLSISTASSYITINGKTGIYLQKDSSTYADIAITTSSEITLAAGIHLTAATGASSFKWGSATGDATLPTGSISWTGASNKTVNLTASGSSGTFTLDCGTTTASLFTSANARTINIATGAAVQTVHIADGSAANIITLGSTNTSSTLTLQGGGNSSGTIAINAPTTVFTAVALSNLNASALQAFKFIPPADTGIFNTDYQAFIVDGSVNIFNYGNPTSGNVYDTVKLVPQNVSSNTASTTISSANTLHITAAPAVSGGNLTITTKRALWVQGLTEIGANFVQNTGTFAVNSTGTVSLDGSTSVTIGGTNATSIAIGKSGITTTITGAFTQLTGAVTIGNDAATQTLLFGSGAAAKTVTVGSLNSSSALTLQAGTGNMLFSTATGGGTFTVTSGTGAISIGADATNKTITIGATGNTSAFTLDSGTGTINAWTSASARTINIATGNAVQTIHLGDHATPANNIFIGGTASTTTFKGIAQFNATPPVLPYGFIQVGDTYAGGAGVVVGVMVDLAQTSGDGSGDTVIGGFYEYLTTGVGTKAAAATGVSVTVGHGGTGTASSTISGFSSFFGANSNTVGVAVGAMGTVQGYDANPSLTSSGGTASAAALVCYRTRQPVTDATHTCTTSKGLQVDNPGNTGVTDAIGIDIAAVSGASGLNIGLRNAGSTTLTNSFTQSGGNISATAQSSGSVTIGNTGGSATMTLDAGTGTVNAWTSASIRTINIANGAAVQTIHIADGAAANVITLGSTNTSATTTIQGGSGTAGFINLSSTQTKLTPAAISSASVLNLQAFIVPMPAHSGVFNTSYQMVKFDGAANTFNYGNPSSGNILDVVQITPVNITSNTGSTTINSANTLHVTGACTTSGGNLTITTARALWVEGRIELSGRIDQNNGDVRFLNGASGVFGIGIGAGSNVDRIFHVQSSGANPVSKFENTTSADDNNSKGIEIYAGFNGGPTNTPILIDFRRPDGTQIGKIVQTGSATVALQNGSDLRLKTEVVNTNIDALSIINGTPVRDFTWRETLHKERLGFIAQELAELFPEAVGQGGVDPKTEPWTVDYARLVPVLWRAIQQLAKNMQLIQKT